MPALYQSAKDAANYQFCMNTSVLGIEATAQVLIGYIDRIIAEP